MNPSSCAKASAMPVSMRCISSSIDPLPIRYVRMLTNMNPPIVGRWTAAPEATPRVAAAQASQAGRVRARLVARRGEVVHVVEHVLVVEGLERHARRERGDRVGDEPHVGHPRGGL